MASSAKPKRRRIAPTVVTPTTEAPAVATTEAAAPQAEGDEEEPLGALEVVAKAVERLEPLKVTGKGM